MTGTWNEVLDEVRTDPEFKANMLRYLDNPADRDRYELFGLMIDKGFSPWQAARARAATGKSNRSQSTLYYLARQLASTIRTHFGVTPTKVYEELMANGEVEVDALFVDEIVEALKLAGKGAEVTYRSVARVTLTK